MEMVSNEEADPFCAIKVLILSVMEKLASPVEAVPLKYLSPNDKTMNRKVYFQSQKEL